MIGVAEKIATSTNRTPQLRDAVLACLRQLPPGLISQAVEPAQDLGAVAVKSAGGKAGDVLQ